MSLTPSLKNRVRRLEQAAQHDSSRVGGVLLRADSGGVDAARLLVRQMRAQCGTVYIANLARYDLGLKGTE